ncbi:uncharacterized protein LOC130621201 [Hydractinia symbiolongicarpus]|uniref:uncharacterized protein LOC130621201 n=1 Tax=Hydractinia symbiolongicarpus TaxID=13093 RepID=UPI00254CF424|nr:uncharacterized protein LOC130621201 [Hydractinia symbiolongicarpus]
MNYKVEQLQNYKFNKINDRFNDESQTGIDKSKWIVNLSNRQLTTEETNLLSKGMNFCMTPASIPKKEIVAKVEEAIKDLPKEEADTVRAKVSLTLQKSKTPKDNLQKSERLSLKNLKKDKDIIILPADRGRTTVIMNTPDYIDKCNEHINNGPYKLLKKDPTEVIKREARNILMELKRKEYIDDKQYYRLKPCDGPPLRFYGLPKIINREIQFDQ